ncbi:MAG: hypothetical protein BMS9Abin02_0529 [Anaerolineae bacterium]|nr:MAG: hypothetical protein BMS9Abin02_0529 [Anaerolineae bacterium]
MLEKQTLQNEGAHIEFHEGIYVRVPGRDDVEIVRKRSGSSPDTDDFKVIRPLVNFYIKDPNLKEQVDFKGRMELLIRFTQHDLKMADELEGKLVFAYYTEDDGWIRLDPDDNNAEGTRHMFFDGFDGFDGYRGFDAIIVNYWPADPSGAWGV